MRCLTSWLECRRSLQNRNMAEDVSSLKFVYFRVFFYLCLAHLSSASCENNAVGIADGSVYLNASSQHNASTPANNGRLNYTAGSSWCASTGDYLQINLQTLYIICAVSTQGNSQADQWVKTYTLQSSTDGTTWTDYKEHGQSNKKSFKGNYDRNSAVKHILYNGIVARYVRFIVESNHKGACLRVEIFGVPRSKGNIALLKPTSQSSRRRSLFSSYAVDGVKSDDYRQCAHTEDNPATTNPWWRVDLQSEQPVAEVHILNRKGCCADRLDGAEIRVGNSDANGGAANHLCDNVTHIPAEQEKSYFCIPRAYGRYVYIRIPGSGKVLTLCEVEVYSTYISRKNLALRQSAQQIDTDHNGVASLAVDGGTSIVYTQGSCTHTTTTTNPWWRVDLGSSVPVTEVVIVNRGGGDCPAECQSRLNSFEIRIGNRNQGGGETNPSCGGTLSLSGGQTKSFSCKPVLVGRFVFVRVPGNNKVLSLCEVQVYSETRTSNGVKGCSGDPVGISNSSVIRDQRFSASSTRTGSNPYDGRLRGSNAWLPSSNNNPSDFLQIDLGSVYFVCGVATQGNPNADEWTTTYKIETSLNNVNWAIYVENHVEKNFTGNSDKNSVVRSELYEPVAAKFIRFYPVLFHGNKALRVEVYGSLQGCLSSIGNERFVVRTLGTTASSELDNDHKAGWSRLYGLNSWCSASVSLPQYLQFDAKKVITVSGVATQGDNMVGKWVTGYAISYGYDGQKWFDYSGGRVLTGNINRGSIVVNFLSSPFAAQYIRILPKTYNNAICMRVDLLVCDNFQVPFLFVELDDAVLPASSGGSVVLSCNTLVSNQRPPAAYKWTKDGADLSGSSSSLTINYTNAADIRNNYQCARKSSSVRDVECNATYQCSTSLVDLPQIKDGANGSVTVNLKIPGKPVVQVNQGVQARSAEVSWSYSAEADEAPIHSFTLHYQSNTFRDDIVLSDGSVSRRLNHLKPYTLYSVRVKATSVLGTGDWSNPGNFTTSTAIPEVTVQVTNATGVSSQTIYVRWTQPSFDKLNGPRAGFMYTIAYREKGTSADQTFNASESANFHTIQNLKKWTVYRVKMRVNNRDFPGPWSPEKETRTHQDAPSEPQNLQFNLSKPTENTRPRMTVTWGKPAAENGDIQRYTLVYSYNYDGKVISNPHTMNDLTLSYSFDVLGGLSYTVTVRAETIKPGPNATGTKQVPVYRPSIAPQNITSQKINKTTYKIRWDPLSREKSNGDVKAYEVERNRVASSRNAVGVVLKNTTEVFAVLHGLTSCSTYKVKVRAYTSAGPGIFGSLPKNIVTTAPGPPSNVRIENTEKRAVTLQWNEPILYGNDVEKYMVIYEGKKDYYPHFKHAGKVETKSLTSTVKDLYPGTKYNFVIIATTHCGPGENSSVVSSETRKDVPLPPGPPEQTPDLTVTDLPVNVTVRAAPQNNGPISYYQVLVHLVEESTDTVSDWTKLGSDLYIAAQIPSGVVNPSLVFALGDGNEYGGFVNKKLSSGQKYNIYSRALTFKSKKRSTEDQFLVSEAVLIAKIEVKKEIIPNPTAKGQGGSPTAAIAASVVVVLILVLVAAVVGVIFWRRRRRTDERTSKSSETHAMTAVNVNGAYDTLVPDGGASRESTPKGEEPDAEGDTLRETSEPIYGNTAPEEADDTPKPIPVSQFSEYVTRLKRDKNAGFASQYKLLVTGQQFAWDVAKKPENKSKNRYGNIIAYDHSRVVLPLIEGVEHSDYHNANYLDGYDGTPKTYIACQGPVPGTFQDFWRMIWLENVSTIVMLTRLVEHGRTKCHQYWPENSETYHDITVANHKTETFADYAIRTFVLCKNGSEKRRQVQQFHFLVWPDKGVPRHATAVLGLRRKVRAKHTDNKAPLVVHCSAGVGRTGAFVVIDAMMESAQNKKVVDVFNYVQLVRKNRISMVQTEEQYGFIYMALLEALTCGNTEVPAHDIRIAVKKLAAVNPKTKLSGLASEYQRLDLITADDVADREDEVGRRPQNAAKNRFSDIVPLDGSRVFLKGDEKNNYINASFVDTFRERNAFIMTQAPMDNTIQDFWKMVWDYNVGTIVMLNEQNEKGQVYSIYWPSEGSATFGEFVITTTSHEVFQDFSEREFTLALKKNPNTVRHVQHYQVTGWPDKGIPKNAHCILDLINMVERAQRKTKNAPVVVQCSDGVGRSGTFCAILSIIERLKSEQVIDVLQSVKVIRVNRPRAVNSKAQYVFCYNIVQKYLDSFNDYANFN